MTLPYLRVLRPGSCTEIKSHRKHIGGFRGSRKGMQILLGLIVMATVLLVMVSQVYNDI
jgi:hypothetical protein